MSAAPRDPAGRTPRVVVAGLGSEHRRDDGAGPLVAARAVAAARTGRDVGPLADPLDLLGLWDGAELAIVVDAVRSGGAPGTVRVVELHDGGGEGHDGAGPTRSSGPTGGSGPSSTHGIGLAGVFRLACALGHAPRRVVVVGIEAAELGRGEGLSPAVEASIPEAVRRVLELMGEVPTCA